ncbi:MAG: T9SS type A sorting domain-containing protein [Bacteroidetes bacterium]|nr:T9SS type A sorting domain-containing protein [Bacteroidota bacterium]
MKTPSYLLLAFILCLSGANGQNDSLTTRKTGVKFPENKKEYKADLNESNGSYNQGDSKKTAQVMAPSNDNCSGATVLTINGGCTAGTTSAATAYETNECTDYFTYNYGKSYRTTWYRFNTGSNTSLNLAWIYTNSPSCPPSISIFGPFNAGSGCVPNCTVLYGYADPQTGDPGFHAALTGLTANKDYLIQIGSPIGNGFGWSCGATASDLTYCVGIYTKTANDDPSTPTILSSCGAAFNGSNIGYVQYNPSAPGNLDNNASTTCSGCTSGYDVPYAVNNDSWFQFCPANASTWNITLNNINSCVLPNTVVAGQQQNGVQMSLLTGSITALTNLQNATYGGFNNIPQGQSWTSSNFSATAGQCFYLIVDGFAGDQCNYSFTLNNVSGGCVILPIELVKFNADFEGTQVKLSWQTATETNSDFFTVQKSTDGTNFSNIGLVKAAGNSNVPIDYSLIDTQPVHGVNYYRLLTTDKNGKLHESSIVYAVYRSDNKPGIELFPNPASESVKLKFTDFTARFVQGEIYDHTGHLLQTSSFDLLQGSEQNVDISALQSGIYFIKVSDGKSVYKTTFVKSE